MGQILSNIAQSTCGGGCGADEEDLRNNFTSDCGLQKPERVSAHVLRSSTSAVFLRNQPTSSGSSVLHNDSSSNVASRQDLLATPESLDFGSVSSNVDSCITGHTPGSALPKNPSISPLIWEPFSDSSTSDAFLPTTPPCSNSDSASEKRKRRRRRRRRGGGKFESGQGDVQLYKECPVKEIWIKHYSSLHKMLLVGEGDFSFSASLALAFGSAINMIATSLDSFEFLASNYRSALANIQDLKFRGCTVLHGIDATQMENSCLLKGMMFDRIIFNFPHAGCFRNESHPSQIRRHQELVRLFLKNAKELILQEGEIHISHKSNACRQLWNLEHLAVSVGLHLKGQEDFALEDYPGYNTKYGYAQFGDRNFDCYPSKTYRFGL